MWLGRHQLGQTVPLLLLCRSAAGTATIPTRPPVFKCYSASALVRNKEMPITERFTQPGLFYFPLFLNGDFATGQYQVLYYFRIGSDYGVVEDNFEVVGGGQATGEVTNMHFYARPHADFIMQSLEAGLIVKGRNPKV